MYSASETANKSHAVIMQNADEIVSYKTEIVNLLSHGKWRKFSSKCLQCGIHFNTNFSSKRFCCYNCKQEHYRVNLRKETASKRAGKKCKYCGKPFKCTTNVQIFCSIRCKGEYRKPKDSIRRLANGFKMRQQWAVKFKCKECGKGIQIKTGREDTRNRRKWCSVKCGQAYYNRTNIQRKLRKKIGMRVYYAMKYLGLKKIESARNYLGCTGLEYRKWIEELWKPGMTWENYGKKWEIDHIQPVASFDLTKEWHLRLCFHFSNTQPLWKNQNLLKRDKIVCLQINLPI